MANFSNESQSIAWQTLWKEGIREYWTEYLWLTFKLIFNISPIGRNNVHIIWMLEQGRKNDDDDDDNDNDDFDHMSNDI